MRKLLIPLLILIGSTATNAQKGVKFYKVSLEEGLEIAKKENKSVLVDAYAPWCIPCKKMDKFFNDPVVGEIYNQNFVNVKLNVDLPENADTKAKYDIVFLPTIMVLDTEGRVRYKVDKYLDKKELLQIANLTADPNAYYASEATRISSSPIHQDQNAVSRTPVKKEDVTLQPGEKILAVLDANTTTLPPEIMYQEAYLRLEKMDASYRSMARRYLDSQDDWTSEKNLRFIFDFLDGSNQKTIDFFMKNRYLFEQFYSAEEIQKSAGYALHNRLYKAVPRPDKAEATAIFSFLKYDDPEAQAMRYLNNRKKEKN